MTIRTSTIPLISARYPNTTPASAYRFLHSPPTIIRVSGESATKAPSGTYVAVMDHGGHMVANSTATGTYAPGANFTVHVVGVAYEDYIIEVRGQYGKGSQLMPLKPPFTITSKT